MQIYLALLRGINVGGNNIINMMDLRVAFEDLEFERVTTYIQTGNVVFTTRKHDVRTLEKKIEQYLSSRFEYTGKVVVKTLQQMQDIVSAIPKLWLEDDSKKYRVMFLRDVVDRESILDDLIIKKDIEEIAYYPGVVFYAIKKEFAARGGLNKLPGHKLYQEMTLRNLNSTQKIYEKMCSLET